MLLSPRNSLIVLNLDQSQVSRSEANKRAYEKRKVGFEEYVHSVNQLAQVITFSGMSRNTKNSRGENVRYKRHTASVKRFLQLLTLYPLPRHLCPFPMLVRPYNHLPATSTSSLLFAVFKSTSPPTFLLGPMVSEPSRRLSFKTARTTWNMTKRISVSLHHTPRPSLVVATLIL